MQIAPTGAEGTGVSAAKLASSAGQAAAAAGTAATLPIDSALVGELAAADLLKLSAILQPGQAPERLAHVDNLLRETVQAMAEGRVEWAVGRLIEAATADPAHSDALRSKPELQAIRTNVDHLLARLANVAKMDAETKLAAAEQLFEETGWKKLPQWETPTETLIHIAHRLLETGGYANYVRTAELASAMQSAYWGATLVEIPVQAQLPVSEPTRTESKEPGKESVRTAAFTFAQDGFDKLRRKIPQRVIALWNRAPLLVMLLCWLITGAVAGLVSRVARAIWSASWIESLTNLGFEAWALGFLAIVGFGFWAQVRKPRA